MYSFILITAYQVPFVVPDDPLFHVLTLPLICLFPPSCPCPNKSSRTFTTVADGQQTVQFPIYQGERVNCEDNTSLGEFTLAPIPPMKAGEAVLEVIS